MKTLPRGYVRGADEAGAKSKTGFSFPLFTLITNYQYYASSKLIFWGSAVLKSGSRFVLVSSELVFNSASMTRHAKLE